MSNPNSDVFTPYVNQQPFLPVEPKFQPPHTIFNYPRTQTHTPFQASEFELATIPPQPAGLEVAQRNSPPRTSDAFFESLKRHIAAQEDDRQRRMAWEREQEARLDAMARDFAERRHIMQQEIDFLKAYISQTTSSSQTAPIISPPHASSFSNAATPQLMSPISPLEPPLLGRGSYTLQQGRSQSEVYTAVLGQNRHHESSTSTMLDHGALHIEPGPSAPQGSGSDLHPPSGNTSAAMSPNHYVYEDRHDFAYDYAPPSTPARSSYSSSVISPQSTPAPDRATRSIHETSVQCLRGKAKRRANSSSAGDLDSDYGTESSAPSTRPRKRTNHHDKRCLTIQHAIRTHFWQMLGASSDSKLPPSHVEGTMIGPDDPVRMVWDKTTKQSIHNARMKARILADVKQSRQQYKHVPSRDFNKKILDTAFEQCFTTFRQKWRAQVDETIAAQFKRREDAKARKARRASRKKTKLSNRADARMKIRAFEDVAFDYALRAECMSSEESDFEGGVPGSLRTRGYAWRSSRLLRLFRTLDEEDICDKASKPRRGVGKRDRVPGPSKEGNPLPPKDVASWMISRKWLKETRRDPKLNGALQDLILDGEVRLDWSKLSLLGEETEVSGEEGAPVPVYHRAAQSSHQYASTSSSLQYALGPR